MDGIGLTDAIQVLRDEIMAAQLKSAGAVVQFPIESFTIELKLGLTRSVDGKVGFKVPFIGAQLSAGAGMQQETTQTVTIVLGPPVDRQGQPIKVAEFADKAKG